MLCNVHSWKNINSLSRHVVVCVCTCARVCVHVHIYIFLTVTDTFWFYILDIDECASGKAVCPYNRRCVNTFGSYYCKCHVGFELKYISGRYDCIGKIWCHCFLFPCLHQTCRLSLQLFRFSVSLEQSAVTDQLNNTGKVTLFMFQAFREL